MPRRPIAFVIWLLVAWPALLAADPVSCPVPGSTSMSFHSLGSRVAFFHVSAEGEGLWVSDGTAEGTRPLTELCGTGCTAGSSGTSRLGDGFLFGTREGLWFSDGTETGTRRIFSYLGPRGQSGLLPDADSRVLVSRGSGEFWMTDGTVAGTVPVFTAAVLNLPPRAGGGILTLMHRYRTFLGQDEVFFAASAAEVSPWHVWRTRGTAPVQALALPNGQLTGFGQLLATTANHVFFDQSSEENRGLWVSDGTLAGTRFLGDPGAAEGWGELQGGRDFAFFLTRSDSGVSVWRSDGTVAGTRRLETFPHAILWLGTGTESERHDLMLFAEATFGAEEPKALYAVDGAGVRLLGEALYQNGPLLRHGDRLVFTGFDAAHGREPWATDGTAVGTRRLADLCPGPCSSDARVVAGDGERLFFFAASNGPGTELELWIFDDLAVVPRRLSPPGVAVGPRNRGTNEIGAVSEGRLFFEAGPGRRREPWISDGTPEGTRLLVETSPGDPLPPPGPWLSGPGLAGFRAKVVIEPRQGSCQTVAVETDCLAETLCLSGAVVGRPEVFLRVVGPKPNGFLWPTIFRSTTSPVYVWIEQISTGAVRYYELAGAAPGRDELDGLFDRLGFEP